MNRKVVIIAILFIIIGTLFLVFPNASNLIYEKDVRERRQIFITKVEAIENGERLNELYNFLVSENERIYNSHQSKLIDESSYERTMVNLNDYGLEDNIIGYINIPKINIELPIILGANQENMRKGAVHLTQTSYPVGGINTNSVIAAHRGYGKAEMFRHIEKLELDDEIDIRNFKEELIYKVYEKKIINQSDIDEIKIEEGEDIITLLSCQWKNGFKMRYMIKARRYNK